jgi:arginyl-tRNA---protein transferase
MYKPQLSSSCCKSYTIRLDAAAFMPNRQQRKLQHQIAKMMGNSPENETKHRGYQSKNPGSRENIAESDAEAAWRKLCLDLLAVSAESVAHREEWPICEDIHMTLHWNNPSLWGSRGHISSNLAFRWQKASAASSQLKAAPVATIAEKITAEMSQRSKAEEFLGIDQVTSTGGFINMRIASTLLPPGPLKPSSTKKENKKIKRNSSSNVIHASTSGDGNVNVSASVNDDPKAPRLVLSWKPAAFNGEEHQLYVRYQMAVHGDDADECSEAQYSRFLCENPFPRDPAAAISVVLPGQVSSFGGYHVQYRLDGALIAVAVVDVLPTGLSSVYFFYDPDYKWLSPGRLSALCEIQWVQEASQLLPSIQYYYMGYYIDTCTKMRYKGEYAPSELLCPYSMSFVPLAEVLVKWSEADIKGNKRPVRLRAGNAAEFDVQLPAMLTDIPIVQGSRPNQPPVPLIHILGGELQHLHQGAYRALAGWLHQAGKSLAHRIAIQM